MTVRFTLVAFILAASPAFAQPAPTAASASSFEKDLDALFVKGGLTADQAASRAGKVSPTVQRRIAEVEAAVAGTEATRIGYFPQLTGNLIYTRLSALPSIN